MQVGIVPDVAHLSRPADEQVLDFALKPTHKNDAVYEKSFFIFYSPEFENKRGWPPTGRQAPF